MSQERVIFGNTVDSLYLKTLDRDLSYELRSQLRTLGMDLDGPLQAAYPHTVWVACLDEVGRTLYPDRPLEDARRQLARRMIEGYAQTVMGAAVLTLARVLGPMRSLGRMTHNFRSGNNFTETRVTVVTPTTAELWFNEPEATEGFVEGVLEEGLHRIGVRGLTITRTRHDPESCTYRLEWYDPSAR
ncbi:DUF2378 family protein [Myxococcus sp. K15C18031901]|uniref:DUF2378 family protein n=1 Tax=Myxococcus dinghuensis TaxID=2906761 RepID=UPI0020A832F9|nr:DUF2378 family protein [Myxococcus dinghuensis]MCP3097507.1 DUF2378 family protein [Myxococcus dinghuensis]